MEKIYVFGHRNPDTDSVTAAINLSYLKNKLGMQTVPAVLSPINNETKFALDYFKVEEPIFLNDVKIAIKDLKYKKHYTVYYNDSVFNAYHKMEKAGISKIPVVDRDKKLIGIFTMKDIAFYESNGNYNVIDSSYDNIVEAINGVSILKFDNVIQGNLLIAGYRSTTIIEEQLLNENDILIVGDRHSIIEYAINARVKLIVLTGNHEMKSEHLELAKKNKVNVIKTSYDTLTTSKKFDFCNNVITMVIDKNVLCVEENESLSDFIAVANRTRYSYYPVVDANEKCLGVLRYSDIGNNNRKKVILVDHNSYDQSAVGLDEAEILEVVDHHNIGSIGTRQPINFRNMPLGSTNTIIYLMYKENKIKIPKDIAGLMLSGILSDTLILTSPTTTDIDKEAVKVLSKIARVNYQKYGFEMLKAGCSISGKSLEEVLYTDYKVYTVDDKKIGLGQVPVINVNEIFDRKQEYIDLLNEITEKNGYKFTMLFITDIINHGTYCLYSDNADKYLALAFKLKHVSEGVFLKDVVSRKKQILPKLMMILENK